MELVLPMCYVHPYFSLKNLGKRARTIHGKTRPISSLSGKQEEECVKLTVLERVCQCLDISSVRHPFNRLTAASRSWKTTLLLEGGQEPWLLVLPWCLHPPEP